MHYSISMKSMNQTPCPCGSSASFTDCCKPIIERQQPAITAEQLMRSRYTAYALGNVDYLRYSWHPDYCPADLALGANDQDWFKLDIKATEQGQANDDNGRVEFVARYKLNGKAHRLHETSRFTRLDGRWVYCDGDIQT